VSLIIVVRGFCSPAETLPLRQFRFFYPHSEFGEVAISRNLSVATTTLNDKTFIWISVRRI